MLRVTRNYHKVLAKIRVTAPPSLTGQVQTLFQTLANVGHLDYFRISRELDSFGAEITVKYLPSCRQKVLASLLFDESDNLVTSHVGHTEIADGHSQLVARLEQLVGDDKRFQSVRFAGGAMPSLPRAPLTRIQQVAQV